MRPVMETLTEMFKPDRYKFVSVDGFFQSASLQRDIFLGDTEYSISGSACGLDSEFGANGVGYGVGVVAHEGFGFGFDHDAA
jgi:hypothetical protein